MFNGERLKQARQNKGYTQAMLAEITGVKQQMISKLETGKSAATADIVKLALALDVEAAWLQGLSEESAPYVGRAAGYLKLNPDAVQKIFEFLQSDQHNTFHKLTAEQQKDIFTACYDACLSHILSDAPEPLFPLLRKVWDKLPWQ